MDGAKEEEVLNPMEILDKTEKIGSSFLELQEANNISKAAYKEIMKMAFEVNTWVMATPALGALEELQKMFHSPPPPGRRVACSIESAIIPIAPNDLIHIMLNVDIWASLLSHIVYRASSDAPPVQLINDEAVRNVLMVNAELQLPTSFIQTQKFCFFRFLRQIIKNIWAIIDVSNDYFPCTSTHLADQHCRRRPSGLIIRSYENHSQVIWIENMEVIECPRDNIYSGIINANVAFSARHWICALISRLKRNASKFINANIQVGQNVHSYLLNLTESMKRAYLDIVSGTPDERKWDTFLIRDIRILRKRRADHVDMLGSNSYIAVTSFRVEAKPHSVFDFFVKKNMEMQCAVLSSLEVEHPEEVIKLVSCDYSNCITLHKKGLEYLLQEASWDGLCNFAISTPMNQLDVKAALSVGRWKDALLQPSGFAVMPDESDGLNADASLVTIAMQRLDFPEIDQAIEYMHNLIGTVIQEIHEAARKQNVK